MLKNIKREICELRAFLNALPITVTALLITAVFSMNLLANKSISLPFPWLALDSGIIISWLLFLVMDTVTKHFGPKCATALSVFGTLISLFFSLIFALASAIPGVWGEATGASVTDGAIINTALDRTFGGTWYVVVGSALSFVIAAAVNNFSNHGIGRMFRKNPDGAIAFFFRAYLSTALGQFVDNLIFSLIVSRIFFGWTLTQCLFCALTGMLAETLLELVFWRLGYVICQKWKSAGVGKDYFDLISKNNSSKAEEEKGGAVQ